MPVNKRSLKMARKQTVKAVNSDKSDKFISLAKKRGAKVLKSIEVIGNLSRRASYEYTEEQVDKLFQYFQDALEKQRAKFTFGAEEEAAENSEIEL